MSQWLVKDKRPPTGDGLGRENGKLKAVVLKSMGELKLQNKLLSWPSKQNEVKLEQLRVFLRWMSNRSR
jgi:hypothetical protein